MMSKTFSELRILRKNHKILYNNVIKIQKLSEEEADKLLEDKYFRSAVNKSIINLKLNEAIAIYVRHMNNCYYSRMYQFAKTHNIKLIIKASKKDKSYIVKRIK